METKKETTNQSAAVGGKSQGRPSGAEYSLQFFAREFAFLEPKRLDHDQTP